MIDPMANLGDEGAPGAPTDQDDSKDIFDPLILNLNLKRVDNIRSFMGIISGCFAGICGLTGLEGFGTCLPILYLQTILWCVTHAIWLRYTMIVLVCFILLHVLVAVFMWAFKMNMDLKTHTRQSWIGYLTTNLQPSALSFMLFWTLFYGLVYLYD